jgi:hypothetical protein
VVLHVDGDRPALAGGRVVAEGAGLNAQDAALRVDRAAVRGGVLAESGPLHDQRRIAEVQRPA